MFARTDDQRLLAESLRRLLAEQNEFEHRRQRLSLANPDRLALWPLLAEMGLLGLCVSEEQGGFAGDARTVATVMSELGDSLAIEPFLASAVVSTRIIERAGGNLDALLSGATIAVFANAAGHDLFAAPALRAMANADGYVLSGQLPCVRHGDVATEFLVTAQLTDDTSAIFRVSRETPGLQLDKFRLMDAAGAAKLDFTNVSLPLPNRLEFDIPVADVVVDALEWGLIGAIAEVGSIAQTLNRETFAYLGTRQQFGMTLASFQALQHRAANMFIAAEELAAIANTAIDSIEGDSAGDVSIDNGSTERSALISAAKTIADRAGRLIAHDAIQLHGGMGVSDELNVSHYARRLAVIRAEWGSGDLHGLRFAELLRTKDSLPMSESANAQSWRNEVREFVAAHLPHELARKVELGLKIEKEDYVQWQQILHREGWFAGAWPREFGGQGWDLRRQLIFTQESALGNAPMIIPYGVNMLGPVIYTFGTSEQQREHLPGILGSDIWWCQGYSEPGAGSDLAALKTFAERDGDYYVVNGSKMWTTEAHWADKMHCLVRTDREVKPQKGISFLLIDMDTPGITVQPIVTIDGIHHTNQVFFDNVRVPVSNRVGDEGQGWSIAKFLLDNERVSIADTGPKLRLLRHLRAMHKVTAQDGSVPASLMSLLDAQFADVSAQLLTLCALERHYIDRWADGATPGAEASVLKIRGTEVLQALAEFALLLEGPIAAAHDPEDLYHDSSTLLGTAQQASLLGHEYLYSRCWSIFGGTNEIQRNIIAKRLLS
jgi:alkylation response protein AidB-like acyl-CoA dehydrogenase